MDIIMDGQDFHFSDRQLRFMFLGEGLEGKVYLYRGRAIKIYKSRSGKKRLSEEECDRMIPISTSYLLLPQGSVYDIHRKFAGYHTQYTSKQPLQLVFDLPMRSFIPKVEVVYEDLALLAEHHITVDDLIMINFCYHDGLYFYDPGSYHFEDDKPTSKILGQNYEMLARFIAEGLFASMKGLTDPEKADLKDYFWGVDYIPDILTSEAKPNESVKKYIKRITT